MASARTDRLLVRAFVALAVVPFVYTAAHSWFWQPEHSVAPIATALLLVLLAALVRGPYRWAWLLFTLASLAATVSWDFDAHRFATKALLFAALNLGLLSILLSPPMRARLKRPMGLRHTADVRFQA